MTFLEILLFPLIVQIGARISIEDRIIEGQKAEREEVKFLASLWFYGERLWTANTPVKHKCGGTLIAPEWVLTAAHCFRIQDKFSVKDDWIVKLGKYQQNSNDYHEQHLKIAEIIVPKQFKLPNMLAYDIALLRLVKPAMLTDYVQPFTELDVQEDCAKENIKCTVFGWGHRDAGTPAISNLPHKAEVKVIRAAECERTYPPQHYNTTGDKFFCAIGEGDRAPVNDACNGDSGGPLFCPCGDGRTRLAGVISAGLQCGFPDSPGGYTRLSFFQKFMNDSIH